MGGGVENEKGGETKINEVWNDAGRGKIRVTSEKKTEPINGLSRPDDSRQSLKGESD